jgi:phage tail sheath protein FI
MPEYLYPGVYVEEIDTGNKPIEGVSTSTVGFLGIAERGPTNPTLITSFGDYTRVFGRYVKDSGVDRYLAYAVEGFFQNGGKRCFVQRVVGNTAKRALAKLPNLTIWATGPGVTGNNIAYQISDAGLDPANLFKLTVLYWAGTTPADLASSPTMVEVFDNLSSVPGAGTFYESEINDVSNLIVIKQTAAGRPGNAAKANLQVSKNGGLTPTTALTNALTLILTSGTATITLAVNTAAGPIRTVADLIGNINADSIVGAKVYLDASGNLNVLDPQGRGNLAVTGTLAVAGAALDVFAATTASAGPPALLAGGIDGAALNPDVQVGGTATAAGTALPAGATLTLTAGPAAAVVTVTFTQGAPVAAPINTVGDLIKAISADATVGTAVLDATGHLTISDPKKRGNLAVTGSLSAGGAGNLGPFAAAVVVPALVPVDFSGFDPDPFAIPAFGATTAATKSGLLGLQDVDEISILNCPDEFYLSGNTIAGMLTTQCETMKDRFAILQAPLAAVKPENNNPSINSKYAAYYYPWLKITNPLTGVPLLAPSGGHIAGIYARSDTNVGVHKDPANEVINGIAELQLQTNDQQQAILNPKGVDVLRYFKGAGNLVWGGRTTSTDPDWKYINVRRLFIFIEKSILRGTQWVVFEINDEPLWARVRRSIGDFLTTLWRDGMLQGTKKEQAFFVKCDRTTMTQADIDNGRLICVIGIAAVKPAEFVIFRIGQWYGGFDVSEG